MIKLTDDELKEAADHALVRGVAKFQTENPKITQSSENMKKTFLIKIPEPDLFCIRAAFPKDEFDAKSLKRLRIAIMEQLIFDIYGHRAITEESIQVKYDDIIYKL